MSLGSVINRGLDPGDIFGARSKQKQEDLANKWDTSGLQMPGYADQTSLLNPDGTLKTQYQLQAQPDIGFSSNMGEFNNRLNAIQLNKQGLEAIRKRALTEGPSDWQKLALAKQGTEEQNALQQAVAQSRGQGSSAFSDLARRGGLSSGARERLGVQNARNLSQASQQVGRTGMGQRQDLAIQDEQQRLAMLSQLPGMEVQALQPELEKTRMYGTQAEAEAARQQNLNLANRDYTTGVQKSNLANTLGEVGRQDTARLEKYKAEMANFAAQKQASATAQSGGGGKK